MRQTIKRVSAFFLAFVLVLTSAIVLMPAKNAKAISDLPVWKSLNLNVDYSKLNITSGMTPVDLAKQMQVACTATSDPEIQGLGSRLGIGFVLAGTESDEGIFERTFNDIIGADSEYDEPINDNTRIKFEVIGIGDLSLIDIEGNDRFPVFKVNGKVVEPEKHKGSDNDGSDAWMSAVSSTNLLSVEYYRRTSDSTSTDQPSHFSGTVSYIYVDLGTFAQFKKTVANNGGKVDPSIMPADTANVSSGGVTVDTDKLKADNVNTEVKEGSAAANAGLNVNEVIDKLASNENKDLIKSAVDLGSLKVDVSLEDKAKINAKLGISDPETLLAVLAPQYLINGITGNDKIVVDLAVKVTDTAKVDDKVKTEVEKVKTTGESLYYFDADMTLFVNNSKVGALTEFGSPISITIDIPGAIKGQNRVFRLIRTHESAGTLSTAVLEDQDKDPNTFTVSTDKLCTMAFAYRAANLNAPKTGADALPFAMILMSFAAVAFVVGAKKYQR